MIFHLKGVLTYDFSFSNNMKVNYVLIPPVNTDKNKILADQARNDRSSLSFSKNSLSS